MCRFMLLTEILSISDRILAISQRIVEYATLLNIHKRIFDERLYASSVYISVRHTVTRHTK